MMRNWTQIIYLTERESFIGPKIPQSIDPKVWAPL